MVLLTNKKVEEEYSNLKSTKFIILNGEDQLLVNQDTPNAKYFKRRSDTSTHLFLDKGLLYYQVCRENGNSYTCAWTVLNFHPLGIVPI